MEQEQYQDFLCRIAKQVDSLLVEDASAISRFRQHLQNFADKENKHLKWLNKKRELCFKKGEAFSISSDMKVPPEYESPACMFVHSGTKQLPEPKSKEEEYQRCYIVLASIHDHILSTVEEIDNDILPKQTADFIWSSLHELWDSSPNRAFIEVAFERVKADLDKLKPAETEQKTIPSTPRRIWICVKRIPRWIYVLVLFLAALLTCVYFLWWLWTKFWPK